MILLVIPLTLAISGCTTKPNTQINPIVERTIPIAPRPKNVSLNDVKFYVVNEDNLEEFIERFKKDNGQLVFVATSVRGYENIALNIEELRRYMKQQKEIILYYENSINTY